jgi:hypothetical protein
VWAATTTLHLRLYKIRQVQVAGEGDYNIRRHFYNWFLRAVHDSVADPTLTFFTDKACFHLRGYTNVQNCNLWSTINPRQIFEAPFHDQKIGVRFLIITTGTVHQFQSGMSVTFVGHF